MLVDWVLPRAGMMLSFLVVSGVMWESFWLYDDYSAGREARELAVQIADHIAMSAYMNPAYAVDDLSRSVRLPSGIHGSAYSLIIDGSSSRVRVEVLGKNSVGTAFFPPSISYYEGERILELRGFDLANGDDSIGHVIVDNGIELWVTRKVFPRHALVIEAVGVGG